MIKDPSQSYPMGNGLRCVLMHAWLDACCRPGVLGEIKDASNRRKKFYAARNELVEKEMITIDCQSEDDETKARVYPRKED